MMAADRTTARTTARSPWRRLALAGTPGLLLAGLLVAGLLVACTGLDRKALERADSLGQEGRSADAERALRGMLDKPAGQVDPEDALVLQARLVPLLENQGRLGEAIATAQAVHQGWTDRRGERSPNAIAALANLGRLYAAIGRSTQALDAQERSTRMAIEVLGAWHPSAIAARTNLAASYSRLGRHDEAVRLQRSAHEASRRTRGDDHVQTRVAQAQLGRGLLAAGQAPAAWQASAEAASSLERQLGVEHPTALAARADEARALAATQRPADALALHLQLIEAGRRTWGPAHRFTVEQLAQAARMQARLGRVQDALAQAGEFIAGAEQVRAQPGLAREDRRALFAAYAGDYRFFSRLHGSAAQLGQGFRLAELSKARTLLESMSEQLASRAGGLPEAEREALATLEQRLYEHEQAISEADSPRARAHQTALRDADQRRYDEQLARLASAYPRFAQLRDPRIVSAADLQGVIPAGALFVGYLVEGEQVSAWLADDRGQLEFVDLGQVPGLARSVEAFRRASALPGGLRELAGSAAGQVWRLQDGSFELRQASRPPTAGAQRVQRDEDIGRMLGERLLQPLAARLQGRRKLIVSPDGALAQLPFDLLPLDARGGGRLIDRLDLHYTQSLSVYAAKKARLADYARLPRQRSLMAMGNPVYEAAADGQRRAAPAPDAVYSPQQLRETRPLWTSLPGTEAEVGALGRLLRDADLYLGIRASEEQLQQLQRSGELARYRYLHFAVHGFLSPGDPSLSSLVLSLPGAGSTLDGYVTAAEWTGYELRSELTVLSACDTGLGPQVAGEGVMGLPYALFVAGNVNTVLTLWPVYDAVAPRFMEAFYRRLQDGEAPSRGLSQTKREFARDPRTRSPAYWAPFILVGAD